MSELVTTVTLSDEGKRVKEFGFTSGAKHEDQVFSNTRKMRAIFVKEKENNGGFFLRNVKGGTEPSGRGDNAEAFKGIVDLELVPEFV